MEEIKEKYLNFFVTTVKNVSNLSYCKKRKVGALIIKDNNILAFGYNGTYPGDINCCEDENGKTMHNKVLHAEFNAITSCNKRGISLVNSAILCTTSPCSECAKLILANGIKTIYYLEDYKNNVGINFLIERDCYVIKIEKVNDGNDSN